VVVKAALEVVYKVLSTGRRHHHHSFSKKHHRDGSASPLTASFPTRQPQNMHPQDQMDFQALVSDLASIRASTEVPAFGLIALPAPTKSSNTPPGSPIRQHPTFQPSPEPYQSPFQAPLPLDRPIHIRLLQKFIEDLPFDKPSPFKADLFVESPTVERKLVQKPICIREYDEKGRATRWVEIGLGLEDRPQHLRHCVVAGTSKVAVRNVQGQHFVDGDCAIWTRKYPSNWKGHYKHEAEELFEIKKLKDLNTVWCFSAAATVLLEGVETRIECAVPKNFFDVDGVQYEVEPGWQDIVRCLKKAILVWPRSEIEGAPINEDTPSAKESLRRSRKAPSSSDVELASLLDIANHGVEESNVDERQENVVTVPGVVIVPGITHVPNSQSTVADIVIERGQDPYPLPAQEQTEPKRRRASSKKKQPQSMQDVPDHSVQTSEAAEVETPPSTAKRGRKRKNSSAVSTPAKMTTAEKNSPGTKTPAKRRGSAKTTIPGNPFEEQDNGEQGGSTGAIHDNDPVSPAQFGPNLPLPHQNRVSMPIGSNQTAPMTNSMHPAGSSGANRYIPHPQPPSRDQRLMSIFDEQRQLWLIMNQPGRVNNDPLHLQRVQERLRQLTVERDYLLGYHLPVFQQQGMGNLPLRDPRMNPTQQFSMMPPLNSQMLPVQQSHASQYSQYQVSSMSQNNGPYQNPTQHSLAGWPAEDVERARSSVQSTLQRPNVPDGAEQ
jgi:hypothetical protein